MTKRCHSCGSSITIKGEPLTKDYCSPTCFERASNRRFKTSHGGDVGSAGDSDESYSMSNIYNPFGSLFDRRGDE